MSLADTGNNAENFALEAIKYLGNSSVIKRSGNI